MTKPRNSLQAVLERQARTVVEPPVAEAPGRAGDLVTTTVAAPTPKFSRPSRTGRKLIAGHFDPKVAKQLKLLAAEEETTIQALLEEALDLLFVKKGRAALASGK